MYHIHTKYQFSRQDQYEQKKNSLDLVSFRRVLDPDDKGLRYTSESVYISESQVDTHNIDPWGKLP